MCIKYHQHGLGSEYGEDHSLTNNWDPTKDYGNEYSNVYFRMETNKRMVDLLWQNLMLDIMSVMRIITK